MTERILILERLSDATVARMRALLGPGFELAWVDHTDPQAVRDAVPSADYLIASQPVVPAEVIAAAPRLKLIQKWGVGVDNIDLDAARARGIPVARTTGSNAVPVAEFTLGLILSLYRCIHVGDRGLHAGRWLGGGKLPYTTHSLSGRSVGIVGFGAVGQTLARLLTGFGCTVTYTKPTPLPAEREAALNVRHLPLEQLLATSDVVTLNCPLNAATRNMIDAAALARMKPTAVLVNSARGGIVVERDLVEALRNGAIAAAATDVFESEPIGADHPLLSLPNVLVTPHIAASSADSFAGGVHHMFDNIARVSRGESLPPEDVIG